MPTVYRGILIALLLASCSSEPSPTRRTTEESDDPVVTPETPDTTDTPASKDDVSPDTSLLSTPASITNSASAGLNFAGTDNVAVAGYECSLDVAPWQACTSPRTLFGLLEGDHTFGVRAIDESGNVDATPAAVSWTIDLTDPVSTIDTGPAWITNAVNVSITFSGSDDRAVHHLECRLDYGSWEPCTSPTVTGAPGAGGHTFEVRAIDEAGNAELVPAGVSWTLDMSPPEANIVSGPLTATSATGAAFVFSGSDNVGIGRYECQLDSGVWQSCVSPQDYAGLATGSHTFSLRAIDTASNENASPVTWNWTVDQAAPETSILSGPPAAGLVTAATFTFGGTDNIAVSSFECSRDGQGWGACLSPVTYSNLATGAHVFSVRAKDTAGNWDASPAGSSWSIYPSYPADPTACFSGGDMPQLDLFTGAATYWTWNDPHVVKKDEAYWMYASATSFFTFPVRLYRLTATNATDWTFDVTEPVLADAADGAWDAGGLETPAVVFFQGQYHLFYTGYPYMVGMTEHSALDYKIGHAVSADGITFTRASSLPRVAPSGTTDADTGNDWYAYLVAEPAPVVFNGELLLYFTTVGIDYDVGSSLQVIGVIRSTDGINWSAPELALKPDQVLYPRDEDWIGYSTPNAIVLGEEIHLFFDVAHQPEGGSWKQLRLHHASSPDGLSPWVHDAEAIRSAGDFVWAVDEIRSPAAFLDDMTLRLYFAGHELADELAPHYFGVGMMSCELAAE